MSSVPTTPNLGLALPPAGETNWTTQMNGNLGVIDSAIHALQTGGSTGPRGPAGANGAVGIIFAGQWSGSVSYAQPDVVTYNGSSYLAVANSLGKQPDINPNTWAILSLAGAPGPQGQTGPQGPQGPSGGGATVSFPVTVFEGGTGATTNAGALANLGAAANGANADITSLLGISQGVNVVSITPLQITVGNGAQSSQINPGSMNTPVLQAGAVDVGVTGDGTGVVITPSGLIYGIVDALHNGVQIGENINGGQGGMIVLSRAGGGTTIDSNGMSTGSITLTTGLFMPSGELTLAEMTSQSTLVVRPSCPAGSIPQVGVAIYGDNKASGSAGTATSGKLLLGFEGYPTQTTVGGAGSAAAMPTPQLYLQIDVGGQILGIPCVKLS